MKNNYSYGNIYRTVFLVLLSALLFSCDRNRRTTGWDYFPDMFYSTAYETFTKNPNFNDGMTMRVPVTGTVPRGYTPFNYTIDPESRIKAGNELVNPFSASKETLLQGKKIYTIFCFGCHGETGVGNGPLFEKGLYPMEPRNLTDNESVRLKDGEIYHTITLGFGTMGAHGSQIREEDRWKLVLYIRELQEQAKASTTNKGANK